MVVQRSKETITDVDGEEDGITGGESLTAVGKNEKLEEIKDVATEEGKEDDEDVATEEMVDDVLSLISTILRDQVCDLPTLIYYMNESFHRLLFCV